MKILMVEKGRPIEKRVCPKRTTKVCVGCKPCSITTGFAGAGAFSDGKLSLSPDVGGNLPEILGYDRTVELLNESDNIYLKFGADTNVYGIDKQKEIEEIRRKAINANLSALSATWGQRRVIKSTPAFRNTFWHRESSWNSTPWLRISSLRTVR